MSGEELDCYLKSKLTIPGQIAMKFHGLWPEAGWSFSFAHLEAAIAAGIAIRRHNAHKMENPVPEGVLVTPIRSRRPVELKDQSLVDTVRGWFVGVDHPPTRPLGGGVVNFPADGDYITIEFSRDAANRLLAEVVHHHMYRRPPGTVSLYFSPFREQRRGAFPEVVAEGPVPAELVASRLRRNKPRPVVSSLLQLRSLLLRLRSLLGGISAGVCPAVQHVLKEGNSDRNHSDRGSYDHGACLGHFPTLPTAPQSASPNTNPKTP